MMPLEEENKLLKKEMIVLKQELYALRKQSGEQQRGWAGSWHPPSLSWSSLVAPSASTSQKQLQTTKLQQLQQPLINPSSNNTLLPKRNGGGAVAAAESSKQRKVPLSPPPIRSQKHKNQKGGTDRNRKNSDYDDGEDDEVSTDGGNMSEDLEAHFGAAGLHHRSIALSSPQRNHNAKLKVSDTSVLRRFPDSRVKDDDSDIDDSDHGESEDLLLITDEEGSETTFGRLVQDRAGWLVGLLVLQSMSSFILARNEALLQRHLVIVRFLTMLVGAGGNAGNQASVRGKLLPVHAESCCWRWNLTCALSFNVLLYL
jgi:hypothetical protein